MNSLSTSKEMIPATNVTDAHAQNFVANHKLLLTILQTFAYYTILEMLDVLGL
jgi:hypothetical protein